MKRILLSTMAVMAIVAGTVFAADLTSGLQVGEEAGAFNVKDVTGPNKGKSLCYRCSYGGRPVACVFARELNDNLGSLVKQLDDQVGKNGDKKMAAFVVILAEDADAVAPKLEAFAKKQGIKNVPLTIFDGESGPGDYKISKDADVTVLMWKGLAVKSNHAFKKGGLDDKGVKAVAANTTSILK